MSKIKIHVFHTGEVCVAPELPFGGDDCSAIKASGLFGKKENRIWLPVSAYLIEHPKGTFLVDTGWSRDMSPNGVFDKKAQIKSLNSRLLYKINQGKIGLGQCIDEQLLTRGIKVSDLDAVLLTHLDCDHANGLKQVKDAKKFLVSADEVAFAQKLSNKVRYHNSWWDGVNLTAFEWNDNQGPFEKSYDLLGDGSIELINIPGHADGLFAVKVKNDDGKFVLLFSDGGYATKSWQQMITSGIAADREKQRQSLAWIREQSLNPNCIESLANHDPEIQPHVIEF
ncbi:MAG: N-acyl homoserine lactonase family protein [Streptococcus gallolyticus]|uniref:N-acyl homoserine lactonase family protein n=1 Tax=Streptococcus gallolyticus TaxID=315405 RepID=A0A927XM04_9STRE|nr:N-acyl homoserine lactonase family protein [Streptococcus gallolyticus]